MEVSIFRGADEQGWLLEIVDQLGGSTVWDDPFLSDELALNEALQTIEEEGIDSFALSTAEAERTCERELEQRRNLQDVLTRIGAKLTSWQVQALFLGAQTSTNVRVGPQSLLQQILGPDPMLGSSLDDANAHIQNIVTAWNDVVSAHERGRVRLSAMPVADPPEISQFASAVRAAPRRITWFTRGIDAGGGDPIELGPDGKRLLDELGEGAASLQFYVDMLSKDTNASAETLRTQARALQKLTLALENMIEYLMTVSDSVRRGALAEYEALAGQLTDAAVLVPPSVKVGRNERCPCGSGRKWKRCCGASNALQ